MATSQTYNSLEKNDRLRRPNQRESFLSASASSLRAWRLFAIAILVTFVLSFVPIVGLPFVFLFSDVVLLGFSAIFVWRHIRAKRLLKFALVILLWILLSINIGIPELLLGFFEQETISLAPGSETSPEPISARPSELSIVGAANPILASYGHWWEVEPEVSVIGSRSSMGRSSANSVSRVDLPDMLWRRGITSQFNESEFPRLSIQHEDNGGSSSKLTLEYFNASGIKTATYSKQLPSPPQYPGSMVGGPFALLAGVLHFNFWRSSFGLNKPVHLESEVSNFLDSFLGKSGINQLQDSPTSLMRIDRQIVVATPNGKSVQDYFNELNTAVIRKTSGSRDVDSVCGEKVVQLEYGGPGNSSFNWGILDKFRHAKVLSRRSPEDAIFSFSCEPTTNNLIFLSSLGTKEKPVLRISIFDHSGDLQSMRLFSLPRWLDREVVVVPGSWKPEIGGPFVFQIAERIRWVEDSQEKYESYKYRLVNLHSD